jgi:hypothetical protein
MSKQFANDKCAAVTLRQAAGYQKEQNHVKIFYRAKTPRVQRKTCLSLSLFEPGVLCAFARVIFYASVSHTSTDHVRKVRLNLRSKLREINPQPLQI